MSNPTNLSVQHTFTAYLEDRPGALSRVSALLMRRNYNIISLTVGRAGLPGISRLTVVVEADAAQARLVEANLYKLVNVLRVEDVTYSPTISRELMFVKLRGPAHARDTLELVCAAAHARIVDETPGALIVETVGTQRDNEALVDKLGPFGAMEIVRTGVAAIKRGSQVLDPQPHFINAQVPTDTEMRVAQ
ncbi:MAG: acetolactate synthase small subunit [Myxococcota bacterium]